MNNKFPNGITSYLETHCVISMEFQRLIENESGFPWNVYNEKGTGGIYDLAEELSDEFEKNHIDDDWNTKEFLDEIDTFLQVKENLFFNNITTN
jgi:hypothetical protein